MNMNYPEIVFYAKINQYNAGYLCKNEIFNQCNKKAGSFFRYRYPVNPAAV